MIDEFFGEDGSPFFVLSCDICGITEKGPFDLFSEAVEYKRRNPDKWKSLRLKNARLRKTIWHDICAKCLGGV